ncbi:MAG: LLM class flavin-dependent oxidoreductase [Nitrososphaerota archaeon]
MTVFTVEVVPKDPLWKIDLLTYIIGDLGFPGVWLSEHPHNRSSFIIASHLLKNIDRVWIGLGVVNPYTVNPFVIAQLSASLLEIAPGRVRLAIGAGDKTVLESLGIERVKPLEKVREAATIIRKLLTEKRITLRDNIHGRLDFNPRGNLLLYVGAQGPRMLQLSGEIGDGVLVNYSAVEDLRWAYGEVMKGVEKAGKRIEEIDLAAYLTISLDVDLRRAVKTVTPYAAYILSGLPEKIIDSIDIEEDKMVKIREAVQRADWLKLYDLLDVEVVERLAIVGHPKVLEERIREIVEIGYTQIVVGAPTGPRTLWALKEIKKIINDLNNNRIY